MKTCNVTKRIAAAFLAIVMVITLIPATPANAASKKKLTMFVGESFYVTNYTKVKSVKTSKKSVVKVKKDRSANYKAILIAKKAGKATVTVRTQRGTMKYAVTVKKLNFKVSAKNLGNGNVLLTVTNKTKQIFDSVKVRYTVKDSNGNVIARESVNVYSLIPGKASYAKAYFTLGSGVTVSSCTGGVISVERYPNRAYKNRSSKVNVKAINEQNNGSEVSFQINAVNNSSARVSGNAFILVEDAANNIIDVMSYSIYLQEHAVDSSITKRIYKNLCPDYDHYKIVVRAYSSTY
ncbi:hypothetical protein SAMN02910358_02320 [Lachnospiraceae bacterium XBB1006]|nr:hypothetical protein SAMN02910358_02320 [Lachnospiraceae bacterium XBB1006]